MNKETYAVLLSLVQEDGEFARGFEVGVILSCCITGGSAALDGVLVGTNNVDLVRRLVESTTGRRVKFVPDFGSFVRMEYLPELHLVKDDEK